MASEENAVAQVVLAHLEGQQGIFSLFFLSLPEIKLLNEVLECEFDKVQELDLGITFR